MQNEHRDIFSDEKNSFAQIVQFSHLVRIQDIGILLSTTNPAFYIDAQIEILDLEDENDLDVKICQLNQHTRHETLTVGFTLDRIRSTRKVLF